MLLESLLIIKKIARKKSVRKSTCSSLFEFSKGRVPSEAKLGAWNYWIKKGVKQRFYANLRIYSQCWKIYWRWLGTLAFALSRSQQRGGTPKVNQNLNPMYSNFPHGMNYRTPVQNQFIPNIHEAPESNQGSHSSTFSRSPTIPIPQSLYQQNDNYRNNVAEGEKSKAYHNL